MGGYRLPPAENACLRNASATSPPNFEILESSCTLKISIYNNQPVPGEEYLLSFVSSRSSAKNVYNVPISGLLERPIPVWRVQHIFVWCSLSSVNERRMHTIVEEAHLSRTQFVTRNDSKQLLLRFQKTMLERQETDWCRLCK